MMISAAARRYQRAAREEMLAHAVWVAAGRPEQGVASRRWEELRDVADMAFSELHRMAARGDWALEELGEVAA